MAHSIEHEAEELLRYRAELSRRLARAGVHDVDALLGLYQQLRGALEGLSTQEIEWARAKAERLRAELELVAGWLETVRRLKDRIAR